MKLLWSSLKAMLPYFTIVIKAVMPRHYFHYSNGDCFCGVTNRKFALLVRLAKHTKSLTVLKRIKCTQTDCLFLSFFREGGEGIGEWGEREGQSFARQSFPGQLGMFRDQLAYLSVMRILCGCLYSHGDKHMHMHTCVYRQV